MSGWKVKTGSIVGATGMALVGVGDVAPTPEMAVWVVFIGKLLAGLGGALAAFGLGHKIEKAGAGSQRGQVGMLSLMVLGLLSIVLIVGCGVLGLPKPPSVCDAGSPKVAELAAWVKAEYDFEVVDADSRLCAIAAANDLHLESLGDLFLVVDVEAIRAQAFTRDLAVKAYEEMIAWLLSTSVISTGGLRDAALRYTGSYPELRLAVPFIAYLPADYTRLATTLDVALLVYHCHDVMRSLGVVFK